ncbi:hypothetical protein AAH979_01570 [Plantactinospora sp. ZYX-F-223]|uniref:DNA polymerase III subunit beta family protein n=1 Tax=Plantactinospora sp. ZYX-F-223 TaxID=3144103 RepID=UPI0031FD764E
MAAAIDAVRFAVGHGPELPMLGGILFELQDGMLHLVATDLYRLAVSPVLVHEVTGPPVRVLAPAPLVDAARALPTADSSATLGRRRRRGRPRFRWLPGRTDERSRSRR